MKNSNTNKNSKNMKLDLTSLMKTFVFIMLLNISTVNIFSQELNRNSTTTAALTSQKVVHISAYIASISANNTTDSNYTLLRFNSLINDKNPSVYITNSNVSLYGVNPTCLYTDVNGLTNINNPTILKDNIEMITIKINKISDLSTILNLELLASYPKLRYIYFLSSINVTRNNIRNMLQNTNDNYSVIYNIETKY